MAMRFQALIWVIANVSLVSSASSNSSGLLVHIVGCMALLDVGQGLGPGQRGALASGEERRLAPGGEGVKPLLGFAVGAGVLGVHIDTVSAAVQLRCSHLDQVLQRALQAAAANDPGQVDHGVGSLGKCLCIVQPFCHLDLVPFPDWMPGGKIVADRGEVEKIVAHHDSGASCRASSMYGTGRDQDVFAGCPVSEVLCKMRERAKADPSTHYPQTEERLGPLSLRVTGGILCYVAWRQDGGIAGRNLLRASSERLPHAVVRNFLAGVGFTVVTAPAKGRLTG